MTLGNADKSSKGRSHNILVVEDSESLNQLLVTSVQDLGYNAKGVITGAEAIEYITANSNVIVLLDHELPDMTGRDIVKTINELKREVYFIIMTGKGNERLAA